MGASIVFEGLVAHWVIRVPSLLIHRVNVLKVVFKIVSFHSRWRLSICDLLEQVRLVLVASVTLHVKLLVIGVALVVVQLIALRQFSVVLSTLETIHISC